MLISFTDESHADAHGRFQQWRLKNPGGFFLAQKGTKSFRIHHVGCHHVGSPFWGLVTADPKEQHSLTASQKVCSSSVKELLSWLQEKDYPYKVCNHCVEMTEANEIVASTSARRRMKDWLAFQDLNRFGYGVEKKEKSNKSETKTSDDVFEERSWPLQFQEDVPPDTETTEGVQLLVLVNKYERSIVARRKCIEFYGSNCAVCGFNFGLVYGQEAESYIHVHHLKPLSEIQREYVVDPIKDLRPVCPNCHAVIHMRLPPYSIEEVKAMLQR